MLLLLLLNWNYSVCWKYEPSAMFLSCWSFVEIKEELNTGLRWVHSISFRAPLLFWSVSVSVQQLPKNCESLFLLVPVSIAYEIWNSVGKQFLLREGNTIFTQFCHSMTKLEIFLITTIIIIIMLIFLSVPNFLMPALPKFRAAREQILAQGSSPATPLHQIISEVRNRKGTESGLPNFEEFFCGGNLPLLCGLFSLVYQLFKPGKYW